MTVFLIKCPYCQLEIPEPATVCGHCTRDLSLVKPLISQLSKSIDEIALIRLEVDSIRKELDSKLSYQQQLNLENANSALIGEYQELPNKLSGVKAVVFLVSFVFFITATLIFTHWLLLFIYDFNLLMLRIATVILPLLLGVFCFRKIDINSGISLAMSFLLGVGAVTGMLGVTSYIDHVPFLPETTREWREVGEYGFAISCSFFTAFLIENRRIADRLNFRKQINLKLLIEKDASGQFKAPEWTTQAQSLFTAIAPFLSAGTAIVSGLRVFVTN